ncbi:hypothetical protein P3X46_019381 [Hevea brasiliensis]|uniref:Uncharacterized protein n=1 Tax=Hevea brasiliensis TaxID=3981 RepID=A0ABQ9LIJ2_HEVBR|nr:protein CHLOROPLAST VESICULATION [Hevea brasiliensis]KAJ9167786.1 hypothetical protein P3X46_019381 [Hevea brasiliensis]
MAIAASCCLNLPPPTPTSRPSSLQASSNTKNTEVAWFKNEKWRSQCVLGMACIIIGLEMDLASQGNLATAQDLRLSLVESKQIPKGHRWSDRRMCPPWRLNALETIVPENLPRPSSRRRWEEIGYSKNAPTPAPAPAQAEAQAIKVIVRSSNNCFTM